MMALVFRSLILALALALAGAGPYPGRSTGNSGSTITFVNNNDRRYGSTPPRVGGGGSFQSGETSAISEQKSTGDGQQTNKGEATAVSVQKQTGLGGATQTTNNQGVIQALQKANGGSGGGGKQSSNNQVNINSSQLQQNVDGTLVNVHDGNMGVVIVNTNDGTGAVVKQQVINDKPIAAETPDSVRCRYTCIRPHSQEPYCCDNGSNRRGDPNEIHGGKCPGVRALCNRKSFFSPCAFDGQCAKSDKCCYDTCLQLHTCKQADKI